MKIIEIEQPSKKMDIYFLGDTHYPRGKRSKFQEVLKEVLSNKNGYVIGLGDWVESIVAGDPRYNPEEMANIIAKHNSPLNMIEEQWGDFETDLTPLANENRIIGLHSGNHSSSYARRHSFNELRQICRRNDIDYLGDGMAVHKISYKNDDLFILSFHGAGGGITSGYTYNRLDSYSNIISDIDVIAAGHTHKLGVNISAERLRLIDGELKQKIQYHCACGSFLGNYDTDVASYAERKAYKPLPIGYIKISLDRGEIVNVSAVPV